MQNNKTALVWFTNNLRVNDNISLAKAMAENEKVIAVYCLTPNHFTEDEFGFKKTGRFRAKFLLQTLVQLKNNLKKLRVTLIVKHKPPYIVLPELVKTYSVDSIYHQKEFTFEENKELLKVQQAVTNINFIGAYDQFLFHPDDIPFEIEKIPHVFSNFRKKVEKYSSVRIEAKPIKKDNSNLLKENFEIPIISDLGFNDFKENYKSAFPFKGGEDEAINRINDYFFKSKKLAFYKKTRNGLVGKDYSSKLSAWLSNGSVSAKTIYFQVKAFEKAYGSNQSTYWLIFELIWRDFFKYMALKHSNNLFKIKGFLKRDYHWSTNQIKVNDWINGTTEEPFVNANMIELKETGWMSNRGRQNVASYFAKELKLDWRIGASYFESMLIDYDVHSNYGNWQYVAGVGNDPRDRKFNIKLQAQRYDENHQFRKMWLQKALF